MNNIDRRLDILIESIGLINYSLVALLKTKASNKDDYKRIVYIQETLRDITRHHNKLLNAEGSDKR